MSKVVIVVEGGNVQDVLTDDSAVEVCLIDYDNEPNLQPPAHLDLLGQAEIRNISDEP